MQPSMVYCAMFVLMKISILKNMRNINSSIKNEFNRSFNEKYYKFFLEKRTAKN
jgi:hypothetical protein